ncbi:MAG: FAD:protein FMN transferase [Candidatus Omnitrophica bacterium]|nr:FAD:protein FMN transferase [Candidatus Omnitrophota bacterium]
MSYQVRAKFILIFNICWLLVNILCLYGCKDGQLYRETRLLMGTYVEVVSPEKRAIPIAFEEIKKIENLLSKYKEDSEIARLNKYGSLKVSPQTLDVLKIAKNFWLVTDGAFDITVGPLVKLWGFMDRKYHLPEQDEISKALDFVGMDKISINEKENMVKLKNLGMQIDLGGIAKGYAVDSAVKRLRENGIKSCLINAGGDIYCLGDNFGSPWRVAIQHPDREGFLDYLYLKDRAVATSGNYEQYFIKADKRYTHIFNPKTGYPVDLDISSVTVIASDCTTADALATAIFVLGKDKGRKLLEKFPDVEVRIK